MATSKPIRLLRHPATPATVPTPWVRFRREESLLWMTFRIPGDTSMVALPSRIEPHVKQSAARRTDGLWEHTCFEGFVRPEGGRGYLELNFSPSTEWAAYRLDDYRQGMRNADMPPPAIVATAWRNRFELSTRVDLPAEWTRLTLQVNFAAIIEETDGTKSYWALTHPPGDPDFHHPGSFALTLPQA